MEDTLTQQNGESKQKKKDGLAIISGWLLLSAGMAILPFAVTTQKAPNLFAIILAITTFTLFGVALGYILFVKHT